MFYRIALLSVVCVAAIAPSTASAESSSGVVSNLKGHYRADLFWSNGHLDRGSAAVAAANLQSNLRMKHAASSNLTIHSGVKPYTEKFTVGAGPFKHDVKVTKYIGWAGAKPNLFQGPQSVQKVYVYNQTSNPIFFGMSVNKNRFQEFRLEPGTNRWFSGSRFDVKFDSSYVEGPQNKSYQLSHTHNDFKVAGNGIELYHR